MDIADFAVSFARDHLFPCLMEVVNMVRGVPKDVADMKDELQRIRDLIHDKDRMASAEEDTATRDEIRTKLMQLIEIAYRIEDIIDEYMIHEEQQPHDPRCSVLPCEPGHFVRTIKLHFQIANNIAEVKSLVRKINSKKSSNDFKIPSSPREGPSSSRGDQHVTWQHFREDALEMDESEIVGFEGPKDKLIDLLVTGREELTVISVVGMGGLGKTTLARSIFNNNKVVQGFNCHAWITLSQFYIIENLLRDMLQQFCKEKNEDPPHNISTMNEKSLRDGVKSYLCHNRYVVFFDVWNKRFWNDIKSVLIDNKQGSRLLITTRDTDVAEFCESYVEIHQLQTLTEEKPWELFCRKAFRYKYGGCCPEELEYISRKLVKKCNGLPLAIVAIGGLFSTKKKTSLEWEKFYQNLNSELDNNSQIAPITKILGISYNDLPYYLQSCFLYFGIYPEDFEVKSKRLIRQWIAEGFVKKEEGKTMEEVGKEYLEELIQRNLVQESLLTIDGKVKGCRVHDLFREMILRKFKGLCFCKWISEGNEPSNGGNIIRRVSIATNSSDLMEDVECSNVRSLLVFNDKELPEDFVRRTLTKCRLLKLLDFENGRLDNIGEDLGNLIHLRYLSLKKSWGIKSLPKSVVKLQNLETLDLRETGLNSMPIEITELKKLRHLLADAPNWYEMEDGIGGMTCLETLCKVSLPTEKLITALGNLIRLRKLIILYVKKQYASSLHSSINAMKKLEKFHVTCSTIDRENEFFEVHSISSPHMLRKLYLEGKLNALPEWISQLQNLVKLSLSHSCLNEDSLESLKDMKNLLSLSFKTNAYLSESLHIQAAGFQKLKVLNLEYLDRLNSITIEEGALQCLKRLELISLRRFRRVPSDIQHLKKLEVLDIQFMHPEFLQGITPYVGQDRHVIQHVPHVNIVRHRHPERWSWIWES